MMSLIMKAIAIIASAPPNFGVIALEIWRAVLGAAHYYSFVFFRANVRLQWVWWCVCYVNVDTWTKCATVVVIFRCRWS